MTELRIRLEESHFRRLVAGGIVEAWGDIKIALADIGWTAMIRAVFDAAPKGALQQVDAAAQRVVQSARLARAAIKAQGDRRCGPVVIRGSRCKVQGGHVARQAACLPADVS